MKKKWVSWVLALTVMASALTACGAQADETKENTDATPKASDVGEAAAFPLAESYEVSAFAFSNTGQELDKSLFMQEMEKRTNIHWNMTLASSAEIEEKRNLSLNSGDYYDVYIKSGISAIDGYKYGSQKVFIPLEELIRTYMPNLKAVLDEEKAWKKITSADGHIYALPMLEGPGLAAPATFINKKWLDAVGKKVPTTEAEFLDVLRAFRDGDPNGNGKKDEYPIYCPAGAVEFNMPLFGIAMDYNTFSSYKDGKMTYIPSSDAYKKFLAFWANAYKEGLVNADCYTATWDDINAIGQTSDTLGMIPTWGAYQHVGNERDEDYVNVLPFDGANTIPSNDGVQYGALCITDKCSRPELICQWADYLYGAEGSNLAYMGVEGKTYTLDDKGMYSWKTDGEYGSDISSIRNTHTLFGFYPIPARKSRLFDEGNTNPEELFLYKLRQELLAHAAAPYPALSWTTDELNEKADLVTNITNYVNEYQAKVVTGQADLDATWDEYLNTLKGMGVDRLNEIDQAAYSRWLQEQG